MPGLRSARNRHPGIEVVDPGVHIRRRCHNGPRTGSPRDRRRLVLETEPAHCERGAAVRLAFVDHRHIGKLDPATRGAHSPEGESAGRP